MWKTPVKQCYSKSNTPSWVFFTIFKLQKWYKIAQRIHYIWVFAEKTEPLIKTLFSIFQLKIGWRRQGCFANIEQLKLKIFHKLEGKIFGRKDLIGSPCVIHRLKLTWFKPNLSRAWSTAQRVKCKLFNEAIRWNKIIKILFEKYINIWNVRPKRFFLKNFKSDT